MLRDIAVARVKTFLGFKKNLDAEIVQAMIEVQQMAEDDPQLPWFLRKSYSAFATVALQKNLSVPTDFIREEPEDVMSLTTTDGGEHLVVREERSFLRLRLPDVDIDTGLSDPGLPRAYALVDNVFYFYPTPDQIYTINGTYYGNDTVLDTNIENKWLKNLPELLIARSGLMIAAGLRDKEALANLAAMNQMATAKLNNTSTANDMAGMKPVIGGED